jgi:transposase
MSDESKPVERTEGQGALRLRVPERRQMAMVVQCPDDLVPAQHAVRMVAALVETLDVSGFAEPIKARAGVAGRDATDPRLLVGLWLYGCIRGIGSARELARRCEESAAFRWLCGGVTVNHRWHLSRKLCSSLRRSYSFGQRFSFLGESLAEKSLDSNPAVGSVVSDSTGLDFFLGCPFFPFVGRVPRFDRIISRQDRLGATILNSVDPQRPPL